MVDWPFKTALDLGLGGLKVTGLSVNAGQPTKGISPPSEAVGWSKRGDFVTYSEEYLRESMTASRCASEMTQLHT